VGGDASILLSLKWWKIGAFLGKGGWFALMALVVVITLLD
jgi:hypothetical protein